MEELVNELQKEAEQGLAGAQLSLAICYYEGMQSLNYFTCPQFIQSNFFSHYHHIIDGRFAAVIDGCCMKPVNKYITK